MEYIGGSEGTPVSLLITLTTDTQEYPSGPTRSIGFHLDPAVRSALVIRQMPDSRRTQTLRKYVLQYLAQRLLSTQSKH